MDGEAGWWTTSGNIGLPPLARAMGVGKQQACVVCHCGAGRLGTLKYNSFRWRSIRMFNRLSKSIRMLFSCSVVGFKLKFDFYLRNIVDLFCRPGFNNSLDGGDCLHGGHYVDDLAGQLDAAKQSKVASK